LVKFSSHEPSHTNCRHARQSQASKAGLVFPPPKFRKLLKSACLAYIISAKAPVYLAAVAEYLAAEILELSGNACNDLRARGISTRHIALGILGDEALNKLYSDLDIAGGGVIPHIHIAHLSSQKKQQRKTPTQSGLSGPQKNSSAHRYSHRTVALRRIRRYQWNGEVLTGKAEWYRCLSRAKEKMGLTSLSGPVIRMEARAADQLKAVAESHLLGLLERANWTAVSRKSSLVSLEDL